MKPSSFSTLCTSNCAFELTGLLLSLSLFHPNETIYIMSDTKTKKIIEKITPQPKLDIKWFLALDKYDGMNRQIMEEKLIFGNFLKNKMKIMKLALQENNDNLFLDSDIIITGKISDIDNSKSIGLSPQYISKTHTDLTGIYNAGLVWTNSYECVDSWLQLIDYSHSCPEQINMNKLKDKYTFFEFGENYNLQCWRMYLSDESRKQIASHIKSSQNSITYKDKPLKFVHTHFLDKRFDIFNRIIIAHLKNARMYKLLAIIYRVIHNKWVLKIPQQPLSGIAYHNNDSYRELAELIQDNTDDVKIQYTKDTIHCWLEPNLVTYDRPTLEWINNELIQASLLLLGNGDVNREGTQLSQRIPKLPIKPWIFWPRSPKTMETVINRGNLSFQERTTQSIFIGNYENNVQERFRNTNQDWGSVLDEYHCTKGNQHKFTHEQYLMKLRNAKFGLCLRGYGSKCHREVELMGLGTVPLVTPEVNVSSYMEPLKENIHYLVVATTDDLLHKTSEITEEKWKEMSDACSEWYQRNVFSKNCWNTIISRILYTD